MSKLIISFTTLFLFVGFSLSAVAAQTAATKYLSEKVDPEMKRKVALNLKAEPNAKKYIVEIHPARGPVTSYEVTTPQWQDYLAKGQYRFRFKVMFADETVSNWSEFSSFAVEDYKLSFTNMDENIGGIGKDLQNKNVALLQWTPLSDAASYEVSVYQTQRYEINTLSATRDIKKSQIFSEAPSAILKDLKTAEATVPDLESGSYTVKIIARNAQSKIIAAQLLPVDLYEKEKLSPRVITPANTFVREISWNNVADFRKYGIAVYQKNVDPLEMQKFSTLTFYGTTFRIPASWGGGEYTFCVKTNIKGQIYSTDACIDFSVKEGDRTLVAENRFYRDIVKAKAQQYYHHFNVISSTIDYKSEFPSQSSLVEINGQVLNFSYSKNDPGFTDSLNQYYKINAGYFKLPAKGEFIYDLRYGQEFSHYNSYPTVYKVNAGIGFDRLIQTTTDPQSATQLNIFSQHFLNLFANASVQYNYLARYAVDLRVGYQKPVYQVTQSNNQELQQGRTIDYSINALFNHGTQGDRFEVGYLFKSSEYEFKDPSNRNNKVSQSGHYINVGYIMEANL